MVIKQKAKNRKMKKEAITKKNKTRRTVEMVEMQLMVKLMIKAQMHQQPRRRRQPQSLQKRPSQRKTKTKSR
jgi:hypothetical protein